MTTLLGLGLVAMGLVFLWVGFNSDYSSAARAIDSTYRRFTPIPTKRYFLSGGLLLTIVGALVLLGFV